MNSGKLNIHLADLIEILKTEGERMSHDEIYSKKPNFTID